jgi:hypothetical protein
VRPINNYINQTLFIFAAMNRLFGLILLVVYSIFSSFAVAPGHIHSETATENTEKEVLTSSFPEHREVNSIRLTGKKHSLPQVNNFSYDYQTSELNQFLFLHSSVPIYIMHCVFRL